MTLTTRQTIITLLVCSLVLLSGCTGWGTDGPADSNDTEPEDSDDLENAQNQTNDSDETTADGDTDEEGDDTETTDDSGDDGDSTDSDSSDSTESSEDEDSNTPTASSASSEDTETGSPESDSSDDTSSNDDDSSGDDSAPDDGDSTGDDSTDEGDTESPPDDDTDEDDTDDTGGDAGGDENTDPDDNDTESPPDEDNDTDDNGDENNNTDSDDNDTDSDDNDTDANITEPETHTLTVHAGEARAVEDATITLVRQDGATVTEQTDENGIAEFEVRQGIAYTVTGEDPTGETETREITVDGDMEIVLASLVPALPGEAELSITVTDGHTGEPVEGAVLTGEPSRYYPQLDGYAIELVTDENGEASATVYEGGYETTLEGDGYELGIHYVEVNGDTHEELSIIPEGPAPTPTPNETNETNGTNETGMAA